MSDQCLKKALCSIFSGCCTQPFRLCLYEGQTFRRQ